MSNVSKKSSQNGLIFSYLFETKKKGKKMMNVGTVTN
jgi:hypothetical protein